MKALWINDIHLDFLDDRAQRKFFKNLEDKKADHILIAGDIAQAPSVASCLMKMDSLLNCPIHFVLGNHVVVVIHVPPFEQAAWHEGKPSDSNWLPFFACKAAGDVLKEAMMKHPEKRMTVLCGHTHGSGIAKILPNLITYTGAAHYGRPVIQDIFEWE
jgi:predicted MPP superfamily phosphohydrolase